MLFCPNVCCRPPFVVRGLSFVVLGALLQVYGRYFWDAFEPSTDII